MPERILELHEHGNVVELAHLAPGDGVSLETVKVVDDEGEPTGEERIKVHVRSSARPVVVEVKPTIPEADDTQLATTTERVMAPVKKAAPKKKAASSK